MVDKSLLKINREIYALQATKKKLSINDLKAIIACDICHISAVSVLGLLVGFLCKICGKKVTFTMHGTLLLEKKFRIVPSRRIFLEAMLIRLANKIFTVSSVLSQQVKNLYKNIDHKIVAIPNGVSIKTKNFNNIIKKPNTIVCIGGGRKEKRVLDVCKAVYHLNLLNYNIHINVFGEDSSDTDSIKNYDFVSYHGFVCHDKVLNSLSEAYLFIQYSEYEPFSLSVFDAINFNCNVITSGSVGAINYLSDTDLEKVCIVNSFQELIIGIQKQLSNELRTYSSYEHLSWEKTYSLYEENWKLINHE